MTPGVLHVHVWPSYLFIVFLLLKKSSQELYTVSVESMPQYTGGGGGSRCCKGGRVGKDLLCGVLIALAVICAAVAIFLVAFYVVNGSLFHFFFLNDHQEKIYYFLFLHTQELGRRRRPLKWIVRTKRRSSTLHLWHETEVLHILAKVFSSSLN